MILPECVGAFLAGMAAGLLLARSFTRVKIEQTEDIARSYGWVKVAPGTWKKPPPSKDYPPLPVPAREAP